MKYLVIGILIFVISVPNIFGDEDIGNDTSIVLIRNLNIEQQEEAIQMREELLEDFNKIRNKLTSIRVKTQIEMRKENPDWDEIKRLNAEYSRLQRELSEGLSEYREKMKVIQIEFE